MEFNFNGPSGTLQIAFALAVGLGAMGYGAYSYSSQSAALHSTETVDATIVSTSIERVNERRGTDDYRPQATFNYTYEGEPYTSSNMYPGGISHEFETKEDARAQLEGYESGATVTAYAPTDSPDKAFLKHESSNKPLYIIGFGGLFVLGTIVSIFRN
ncbi:DUF3592 domain-containing protein [Haloplanus rubicundus]|uniref:DUF3592 domain-containing protein n=1 Tax=Haloplanus rubicundus TaxID=1547898 RepID=A0A345EEB1_9EURY|nr:DUF3592 domain-containing protein [Haloplanus rubicundus]AXG10533.1 DUF3592 domain-containing protein [Haloplanus rubicundus]